MSRRTQLREAIPEIVDTFTRLSLNGGSPSDAFFFLVGAGLSAPQVPLASQIEAECRQRVAHGSEGSSKNLETDDDPINRYSHWLSKAFPQPIERQEYFRTLIERQPISAANFRLAHLLASDRVPPLVVTTNFDDFLSRALTLFGRPHIVCDHPATGERIDPERREDIQILHVHGSYWFYDCCNLKGEIDRRGDLDVKAGALTVAPRLDRILDRRSPIVIGYSGWEDDAFMTALKRRLLRPLAFNIYWFCHDRAGPEALPDFLHRRDDVCFVVPDEPSARQRKETVRRSDSSGGDDDRATAELVDDTVGSESRLDAVTVLDQLSFALLVDPPALTRNPIQFFTDHLRSSLLFGDGDEEATQANDIYRLRPMIDRLQLFTPLWESGEVTGNASVVADLEPLRNAIRRADYRDAIAHAKGLPIEELEIAQLRELRDTASLAAESLDDGSEDVFEAFDIALAASRALDARGEPDEPVAVELRVSKGFALLEAGRPEDAIAVYDELPGLDHPDETVRRLVVEAFIDKSRALAEAGRQIDAVEALTTFTDRFEDDPAMRDEVVRALVDRAGYLLDLSRFRDALAVFEQVVDRFGGESDPDLFWHVGFSLLHAGRLNEQLGDLEQAVARADECIAWSEGRDDHYARWLTANSLNDKASAMADLQRHREAIEIYDICLERYSDDPPGRLDFAIGSALIGKARVLSAEGRSEEAIEVYTSVLERFNGRDADPDAAWHMANALIERAQIRARDGTEEVQAGLREAIHRFQGHPDQYVKNQVARAQRLLDGVSP